MKEQFAKTTMAKRMRVNDCKARIKLHKDSLASEDYKITKCSELRLINPDIPLKEMPYDVVALVAKRERIRGKINALEAEIKELEAELSVKDNEKKEEG